MLAPNSQNYGGNKATILL